MDRLQGKQGDIVADPLKVTGSSPSLAPTDSHSKAKRPYATHIGATE